MRRTPLPRSSERAEALKATRVGPPLLVTGPPGAGKTTLLLECAAGLARDGWHVVHLDLMAAASSPERFALAALDALPEPVASARTAEVAEIGRLARSGRVNGASAVTALFALWRDLDHAAGHPVAFLFDEATEIRSLAYFAGLRQVDALFEASVLARRRGTLLATSFPTLASRLWRATPTLPLPPLRAEDLEAVVGEEAEAVARASFGWPRHLAVLLDRMAEGTPPRTAWIEEMAWGGRLELACRHTYETLLLRSRGYGICKAALAAVADEEGLNLTALVSRLGRTPGATRDYLTWLIGVDALRVAKKRYFYVDGLVRWWVRLHARGVPATSDQIAAAADAVLSGAARTESSEPGADRVAEAAAIEKGRRESLMEID